MDDLSIFLKSYKYKEQAWNELNQYNTRPTQLGFNDIDINIYNKLITLLKASDLNQIIRTDSGAIAKGKAIFNNNYAWDVIYNNSTGAVITIIMFGKVWVFDLGSSKTKEELPIYPKQAFKAFKEELLKDNIDLDDYKISNGKEIKETICKPLILFKKLHITFDNVHHIDFHSSYPAGLANTHPEFRPTIERIYKNRKNIKFSNLYKAILNDSIGIMQSLKNGRTAAWAHLAKDAIEDNNKRIVELTIRLTAAGCEILGYNTDGIWYKGPIYHGEGEGDKLGEWSNDHINCKFRAKSNGVYEFIENDTYNVVYRGISTYDKVNPDRKKWQWGDIYKGCTVNYIVDKDTKLIKEIRGE